MKEQKLKEDALSYENLSQDFSIDNYEIDSEDHPSRNEINSFLYDIRYASSEDEVDSEEDF